MSSSLLLSILTFVYLFTSVLYLCYFVFRKRLIGGFATTLAVAGFVVNTAGIVLR